MNLAEQICQELNIDYTRILNIYEYGSKVYGTDDEYSDSDHIIVFKSSLLPSGAFKDNAISSRHRDIQGVCYSRSGFIDAINNYEISALECIFLPEDKIIQKKMNFGITKYNENMNEWYDAKYYNDLNKFSNILEEFNSNSFIFEELSFISINVSKINNEN